MDRKRNAADQPTASASAKNLTVQSQTFIRGRPIAYTLTRSRRKSIGLCIDHRGLRISAPLHTALPHIDVFLQKKAAWITPKLDLWSNKKSLGVEWAREAIFPLLGEPWRLVLQSSGEIAMAPQCSDDATKAPAIELTPRQVEKFVMSWYQQHAITCFKQRIDVYAQALRLSVPPFRLSNAATRWGCCNSRGLISLNWRLIQMPQHLIDYVVAHELAHLIEMNHSEAFWRLVENVFPNYLSVRKELRKYSMQ